MKNNNEIKHLISQFEEVRADSKDFYDKVKEGYYKRDYTEAAINHIKLVL